MAPLIPIVMGLAQYAPALMRYFGAGQESTAVAEKVVEVAQAVTGAASPEEALAKMREDAAAQRQFQLQVMAMSSELESKYLDDRADARKRDIAYVQAGRHNVRADLMVLGAVVGLISCLVVLIVFRTQVPGEVVGIVSTVAGIFGACLRDAFQFEFGSSRGSKDKDELLGLQLKRDAA